MERVRDVVGMHEVDAVHSYVHSYKDLLLHVLGASSRGNFLLTGLWLRDIFRSSRSTKETETWR
jgi:hypothetical protein